MVCYLITPFVFLRLIPQLCYITREQCTETLHSLRNAFPELQFNVLSSDVFLLRLIKEIAQEEFVYIFYKTPVEDYFFCMMQCPLYKDLCDEVLLGLNAQIWHILTDDLVNFLSLMVCK